MEIFCRQESALFAKFGRKMAFSVYGLRGSFCRYYEVVMGVAVPGVCALRQEFAVVDVFWYVCYLKTYMEDSDAANSLVQSSGSFFLPLHEDQYVVDIPSFFDCLFQEVCSFLKRGHSLQDPKCLCRTDCMRLGRAEALGLPLRGRTGAGCSAASMSSSSSGAAAALSRKIGAGGVALSSSSSSSSSMYCQLSRQHPQVKNGKLKGMSAVSLEDLGLEIGVRNLRASLFWRYMLLRNVSCDEDGQANKKFEVEMEEDGMDNNKMMIYLRVVNAHRYPKSYVELVDVVKSLWPMGFRIPDPVLSYSSIERDVASLHAERKVACLLSAPPCAEREDANSSNNAAATPTTVVFYRQPSCLGEIDPDLKALWRLAKDEKVVPGQWWLGKGGVGAACGGSGGGGVVGCGAGGGGAGGYIPARKFHPLATTTAATMPGGVGSQLVIRGGSYYYGSSGSSSSSKKWRIGGRGYAR